MEEADCDEDIVFKGSPLHQHLKDAGFTDLDSAERQRGPGGRPEEGRAETGSQARGSCSYAEWIKGPFTRLLSCVGGLGAYAASRDQAESWRRREVATIVARGRLLEEDVELLALFAPEALAWAADPVTPTPATTRPRRAAQGAERRVEDANIDTWQVRSRKPSLWAAVAAALLAVLAVWWSSPTIASTGGTAATAVWCGALAAGAVGLAAVARGLWRRMDAARLRRRCVSTGVFAADCAALTAVANKSLRLVQESEVITRGFTLVSASCSVRTLDLGAGAQLPVLRRSLYWALRSSTLALRDATRGLIASHPLDAEADNVTNYLCAVPLAELGLGMELHRGAATGAGTELRDETAILDEAAELTDGFCLQALKVLYQLWVGQSSEFLRRLVLALYAAPHAHAQGPRDPAATSAHAFVSAASPCVSESLRRLGRSFELHRVGRGGPGKGERPRSAPGGGPGEAARGPRSELWRLHAAVRSLQLHLKTALQDSLSLEDELERLLEPDADASTADTNGGVGGVGESETERAAVALLGSLGPRMEAARACWDEAVTRSRALRPHGDGTADVPDIVKPRSDAGEDRRALVIIDDRDPIPEEQEFESCDADDGPAVSPGGATLGAGGAVDPEERERVKRQRLEEARREREEARRMLYELKSVLGVRTSQEQRAIRRSALFPAAASQETSQQVQPSSSAQDEASTPALGESRAGDTAAATSVVNDRDRDEERRNGVTSSRGDGGNTCEDDGHPGASGIGREDLGGGDDAAADGEVMSPAAGEADRYSAGGDADAKGQSTCSSDDDDGGDGNGNAPAGRDYGDDDADNDESHGRGTAAGFEGHGEAAGADAGEPGAPGSCPQASLRERLAAAQLSGWHGTTRDPRCVHLTSMVASQAATLSRGLLGLQEQTFGDDDDDDDDDDSQSEDESK